MVPGTASQALRLSPHGEKNTETAQHSAGLSASMETAARGQQSEGFLRMERSALPKGAPLGFSHLASLLKESTAQARCPRVWSPRRGCRHQRGPLNPELRSCFLRSLRRLSARQLWQDVQPVSPGPLARERGEQQYLRLHGCIGEKTL